MDYTVARRHMVREQLTGRGVRDPKVVEVMGLVPRHQFVEQGLASQAYEDRPLRIGFQQTISQPYIVALMTEALQLSKKERVLEVGTGCGYQTAILSLLADEVFSIERIMELSNKSRRSFYQMGYLNIKLRIGDGSVGWPEEAPFDAILVTAAAPTIPQPLLGQLKEGGRLVIPEGGADEQRLVRIVRHGADYRREELGACRFVKLYGEHGWTAEA